MSHPPFALALVICDQILNEPGTNKPTLVGLFSAIFAAQFPCVHPRLGIYLALTDGYGANRIIMRIIDGTTETTEVWRGEFDTAFPDPRAVNETYMIVGPLTFPSPGEYRLRVESNDGILMERRILVAPIPMISPPEPSGGPG